MTNLSEYLTAASDWIDKFNPGNMDKIVEFCERFEWFEIDDDGQITVGTSHKTLNYWQAKICSDKAVQALLFDEMFRVRKLRKDETVWNEIIKSRRFRKFMHARALHVALLFFT